MPFTRLRQSLITPNRFITGSLSITNGTNITPALSSIIDTQELKNVWPNILNES